MVPSFELDELTSPSGGRQKIVVCPLGRMEYQPCWDLQKRLQQRLIEAKRQDPPVPLPHVLLLVEHPPVYTLGRNGDAAHLLLNDDHLTRKGASFFHIDRGGDITFHGPGQLVAYPILDLDRFFTDIHRYLRRLEEAIVQTCAEFGVEARRVQGRTGVWVGPDERGPERKLCAMGIRCSRWVTMHGLAFNMNTDLSFFDHIVPCGIRDRGVTSLAEELEHSADEDDVAQQFVHHMGAQFEAEMVSVPAAEAGPFLDAFLAGSLSLTS